MDYSKAKLDNVRSDAKISAIKKKKNLNSVTIVCNKAFPSQVFIKLKPPLLVKQTARWPE